MDHLSIIVKEETLAEDRAVYHIRCTCGDPTSETRHTYDPLRVTVDELKADKLRQSHRSAEAHAKKVPVAQGPAKVTSIGQLSKRKH